MTGFRKTLAVLITAVFTTAAGGCGSTSTHSGNGASASSKATAASTTESTKPAPVETKVDADGDNDPIAGPGDDTNNDAVLHWGQAASGSEARAVDTLLRRYYAAALAADGAKGCAMLYSILAEALPEDYGQSPPGQPYMKGSTCAQVLTKTFAHFHPQLALETPRLQVAAVRLKGHQGYAVLRFSKLPARQIQIVREGRQWRVAQMVDSPLP